MADQSAFALAAQTRTQLKKQVKQLRDEGFIPAVVYGHNKDNQLLQVKLQDMTNLYRAAGESTLVDLAIDNQNPIKVLIHDIAHDVLSNTIEHVDFYIVNMSEKIHSEVSLHFVGIAPAVKELGGTLIKNKDHIAIKCLPQDLMSEIDVDISALLNFEDVIHIKDVAFPEMIEVLDDPEDVIALVAAPRSEEELAALNETVSEDVSKVEGVAEEPKTEEDTDGKTEESADKSAKESK